MPIIPQICLPANSAPSSTPRKISITRRYVSINATGQYTGVYYQDPRPTTLVGYDSIYYTTLETAQFYNRFPLVNNGQYGTYSFRISTNANGSKVVGGLDTQHGTYPLGSVVFPNPDPNIWGESVLSTTVITGEQQWGFPILNDDAICYRKKNKEPNFYDLIFGYEYDFRVIPTTIKIKSLSASINKIRIGYYRVNLLESIPNLTNLQWVFKTVDISTTNFTDVDVTGITLGTLTANTPLSNLQINVIGGGFYPASALIESGLADLMMQWKGDWETRNLPALGLTYFTETKIIRRLGGGYSPVDFNYDANHPLFLVDDQRTYDWHIAPQTEGIGTLTMDSPRIIETRTIVEQNKTALAALKVMIDAIKVRVDTLTNTDLASVARADKVAEIKAQLALVQAKTDQIAAIDLSSTNGKIDAVAADLVLVKNEIV